MPRLFRFREIAISHAPFPAAAELGLSRSAFYRRLERYGL